MKFDEFETLPTNEKLTVAKCYKDLISQLWNKKRYGLKITIGFTAQSTIDATILFHVPIVLLHF